MPELEELTGYVDNIKFRNEDNGYTVLDFVVSKETITCVGNFVTISEGENLSLKGTYTEHPTYGRQLRVTSYEAVVPKDTEALERYLGSGVIVGIGPTLAARIVDKFGDDTLSIIENEPERLAEIKGISLRIARSVSEQMIETRQARNAMIFMEKYGIHGVLAIRIYNRFGSELYDIFQNNPYTLAEEIDGIGFKRADEIAQKIGIRTDSEFRIRCALVYVLESATTSGHTYLPKDILVRNASNLLSIDAAYIEDQINNLCAERKIKIIEKETDDGVEYQAYTISYFMKETIIASMLDKLDIKFTKSVKNVEEKIKKIEEIHDIQLDELQSKAVKSAAENGLFILTGGPGTGKTTTIKTMLYLFDEMGLEICLAAPTGRAAKRMTETCNWEAKTIHRLLEVKMSGDDEDSPGMFERNADNPLEYDVIIIDEMSMVDINLMYALLSAITVGTRLIMVGDEHQLPSVGPGNVLNDMIASKKYTTVTLQKIFRQAQSSAIVVNAHKIQNQEKVDLDEKTEDFFFVSRNSVGTIMDAMLSLMTKNIPNHFSIKTEDIQVLTPTRMGPLGVDELNRKMQEALNPSADGKMEYTTENRCFRVGDKVMQIKNNYDLEWEITGKYNIVIDQGKGVFNGDVGTVVEIDSFMKTLTVAFEDNRSVTYPFKNLDEIELAYAVTVHKSQGSEYPAVIIPLLSGPKMLMNRNILYTAITRAKECVMILGDRQTFYSMADNITVAKRYSGLLDRILE